MRKLLPAGILIAVVLAHCGGGDPPEAASPTTTTTTPTTTTTASTTSGPSVTPPGMSSIDALKETLAYAQTLSQWALLLLGSTAALLIGTTHRSPDNPGLRWIYLVFVPGWALMAATIYFGGQVHEHYLGFVWHVRRDLNVSRDLMNADLVTQQACLYVGLGVFLLWIVAYLLWWISTPAPPGEKKGQ
jgi:hypothetical protein